MYDEGIEVGWLVMAMATTAALVMLVYNSIFMYVCIGIGYGLLELWICEYWRIGHTQSREHTKEWYVLKEEVEEDLLSKYFHLPGVNQFPESSSLWLIITIHQFLQPSFLTTAMYQNSNYCTTQGRVSFLARWSKHVLLWKTASILHTIVVVAR